MSNVKTPGPSDREARLQEEIKLAVQHGLPVPLFPLEASEISGLTPAPMVPPPARAGTSLSPERTIDVAPRSGNPFRALANPKALAEGVEDLLRRVDADNGGTLLPELLERFADLSAQDAGTPAVARLRERVFQAAFGDAFRNVQTADKPAHS